MHKYREVMWKEWMNDFYVFINSNEMIMKKDTELDMDYRDKNLIKKSLLVYIQ